MFLQEQIKDIIIICMPRHRCRLATAGVKGTTARQNGTTALQWRAAQRSRCDAGSHRATRGGHSCLPSATASSLGAAPSLRRISRCGRGALAGVASRSAAPSLARHLALSARRPRWRRISRCRRGAPRAATNSLGAAPSLASHPRCALNLVWRTVYCILINCF